MTPPLIWLSQVSCSRSGRNPWTATIFSDRDKSVSVSTSTSANCTHRRRSRKDLPAICPAPRAGSCRSSYPRRPVGAARIGRPLTFCSSVSAFVQASKLRARSKRSSCCRRCRRRAETRVANPHRDLVRCDPKDFRGHHATTVRAPGRCPACRSALRIAVAVDLDLRLSAASPPPRSRRRNPRHLYNALLDPASIFFPPPNLSRQSRILSGEHRRDRS